MTKFVTHAWHRAAKTSFPADRLYHVNGGVVSAVEAVKAIARGERPAGYGRGR